MNRIYRAKNETAWEQLGRLLDSVNGPGLAKARKDGFYTVLIAQEFLGQCIECKRGAFVFRSDRLFAYHKKRKIYFPGVDQEFAEENGVKCLSKHK